MRGRPWSGRPWGLLREVITATTAVAVSAGLAAAAPVRPGQCLGRHRRHLDVVGWADGKTPVEARLQLPSDDHDGARSDLGRYDRDRDRAS